ncbi:hypothetical protein KIN20_026100 [Parelaphostrongylus tenuis]|uniref:Uncharacterized protein n=1 Tax=Parelaphostrongylus tenuis TaxID=148309 RepID=A0AAD5MW80_PARTN|nr:hypothetical protein KIN20_026100 [Parelaphostrongylus tenuis]
MKDAWTAKKKGGIKVDGAATECKNRTDGRPQTQVSGQLNCTVNEENERAIGDPRLLQMANDRRMVDVEFLCNTSCSLDRNTFDDCSQLVDVSFPLSTTMLVNSKSLVSFEKILQSSLNCMLVNIYSAECVTDNASCVCHFTGDLELMDSNCKYFAPI